MKKLRSFLLTSLLLITCQTLSAYDFEMDGIYYYISYPYQYTYISPKVTVTNNATLDHIYSGTINIPNTVTYEGVTYEVEAIESNSFRDCHLKSINIPKTVTRIGCDAFTYASIGNLIIEESLPATIHENAFKDCYSIENIFNFSSVQLEKGSSDYGYLGYNANSIYNDCYVDENGFFIGKKEDKDYVCGCNQDYSYLILPNVDGIADYAFAENLSLDLIVLSGRTTSIGEYAFDGCTNLRGFNDINNIKSIGKCAFRNCSKFESLSLSESVESIGECAFFGCINLSSIDVSTSNQIFDSRNNCNAIIESATNTLILGCKNTIIPNDIIRIGRSAFGKVTLTSISIPASVKNIDKGVFGGCFYLQSIYLNSKIPPVVDTFELDDVDKEKCILYVPEYSIEDYKTAIYWKQFKNIEANPNIYKNAVIYRVDNTIYHIDSVYVSDTIVALQNLPTMEGYTFYGWSEIPEVMPENDVTVKCLFTRNKHALKYVVDGINYEIDSIEYTTPLTRITETPVRYTKNGTSFVHVGDNVRVGRKIYSHASANTLENVGYFEVIISGTDDRSLTNGWLTMGYKKYWVEYQFKNPVKAAPVKTGHTFLGWSKIPEFMPNHEVIVTGSFRINKYAVKYVIDGELYKIDSVQYSSTIVPATAPSIEGYSFCGWQGMPTKMPAKDITITGTYAINTYAVKYLLDGEEYKIDSVRYGSAITRVVEDATRYTNDGTFFVHVGDDVSIEGRFYTNIQPQTLETLGYKEVVAIYVNDNSMIDGWKTVNGVQYWIEYHYKNPVLDVPDKQGYTFSGWSGFPSDMFMPSHDLTISGSYTETISTGTTFNIADAAAFSSEKTIIYNLLTYSRTFGNTNWQSLYVPFSIPVDSLSKYGLQVAELNDTHQWDFNGDGIADSTRVEFFTRTSGSTEANYPYLIRATTPTTLSLTLTDIEVKAAEENSIECSSVKQKFTFVGTYSGVSGTDMYNRNYYGMSGGGLKRVSSTSVSLNPQRWYMKIENKNGSPVDYYAPSIRFTVDGIDEEEETSGIIDIRNDIPTSGEYYSLEGIRQTSTSIQRGMYVRQGKKLIIR